MAIYDSKIEGDRKNSEYDLHNELNEFPKAGSHSHFPIFLLGTFQTSSVQ